MNYRKSIEDYKITYPNPLVLKTGEVVKIIKRETNPDWLGWIYCEEASGNSGWISESYLKVENEVATLIKNYNATELSLLKNEVVEYLHEEFGWSWVRNSSGQEGWVPSKILESSPKMTIKIIYADKKYFSSFHEALGIVAAEKIYIEMITAPVLAETEKFQQSLIDLNHPVYYALHEDKVVGWADVSISKNPRWAHRGGLGMGLIPGYRGMGLGTQLLEKVIEHCQKIGLEKIELQVYTSNTAAIQLYKKLGFEEEGFLKKYRKLDDQYFDIMTMAKFL